MGPVHIANEPTVRLGVSDSTAVDAFGRLRVSEPDTLFDSKQIFDNGPLFWDDQEESGSGTSSTYSKVNARSRMAVTANTAGKRTRQTFMRFNYQPGKSQLILLTGVLGTGAQGITQRIGLFDDDNGLFFMLDHGVLSMVRRTSTSGSPVDDVVAQPDWDKDKLDGSGTSGITLDSTKTQIFFIDFEWLGVGTARMGYVHDGKFIIAHEFFNSNNLDVVYMSTPNLPVRYQINNDGAGPASFLDHMCASVISEGGQEETGIIRHVSTNGTHVDADVENSIYAIVGIRLKSTHLGATVRIEEIGVQIQTASETGEWLLIFNPAVAGAFTYSDETNSAIQVARGATANTVTNGEVITGGFAQSTSGGGGSGGIDSLIDSTRHLGSTISGTPDTMVLCWRPTGGTSGHDIEGDVTFRELT